MFPFIELVLLNAVNLTDLKICFDPCLTTLWDIAYKKIEYDLSNLTNLTVVNLSNCALKKCSLFGDVITHFKYDCCHATPLELYGILSAIASTVQCLDLRFNETYSSRPIQAINHLDHIRMRNLTRLTIDSARPIYGMILKLDLSESANLTDINITIIGDIHISSDIIGIDFAQYQYLSSLSLVIDEHHNMKDLATFGAADLNGLKYLVINAPAELLDLFYHKVTYGCPNLRSITLVRHGVTNNDTFSMSTILITLIMCCPQLHYASLSGFTHNIDTVDYVVGTILLVYKLIGTTFSSLKITLAQYGCTKEIGRQLMQVLPTNQREPNLTVELVWYGCDCNAIEYSKYDCNQYCKAIAR